MNKQLLTWYFLTTLPQFFLVLSFFFEWLKFGSNLSLLHFFFFSDYDVQFVIIDLLNILLNTKYALNFAIGLKSHLSPASPYWNVAAWEIRRNSITVHMWVTLCHNLYCPMKMVIMKALKLKINCFVCYEQSDGSQMVKTCIYHTITYSWHRVTRMWPVMWLLQIPQCCDISAHGSKWEKWFSSDW